MTQHTPKFPEMKGWKLTRLDGESTPEESKEIEGMLAACLGLLNAGYSQKQATAFILASPELLEALKWAVGVIEICEKNAPDIDWSIGHFGRKKRAEAVIAKAGKES